MFKSLRLSKNTLCWLMFVTSTSVQAKLEDFKEGPVILGYGKHAPVTTINLLKTTELKVAFDLGKAAAPVN